MTAARLIDTARLTAQLAGCTAQLTAAGFPDGKPAAVCPAAGCAALRAPGCGWSSLLRSQLGALEGAAELAAELGLLALRQRAF